MSDHPSSTPAAPGAPVASPGYRHPSPPDPLTCLGGVADPGPEASLASTWFVPSAHPDIVAFTHASRGDGAWLDQVLRVFYAVRDGFRYDPYQLDLRPEGMSGLTVLQQGHGWCINKSALLAACWRSMGLPARLGFADVRNHMTTERMREHMGSDLFVWHGYVDAWIEGRWVKATPAFNLSLCEKFGLHPLDFDGKNDSIYHAYDKAGNRHMEYVTLRGTYSDLPLALIHQTFAQVYRFGQKGRDEELARSSWESDVLRENHQDENGGNPHVL